MVAARPRRPIPTCRQGRATLRNVPATSLAEKFVPPRSRQPRRPPSRRGATMSTPTPEHEATQVFARRTLLKVGAAALGAVAVTADPAGIASAGGPSDRARRRNTQRVTRRLLDAIASGDLARMWSFFDCGGVVSQPFTNTTVTDFATFQSTFSTFFSVAEGLQFTDPAIRRPPRSRCDDRQVQRTRAHHLDRTVVRPDLHHRTPRARRQGHVLRGVLRHLHAVPITRAHRPHPGVARWIDR